MSLKFVVACGVAVLVGGRVPLAAPGQVYTAKPGDPTQARVWIQNSPLSVQVSGTPTVALSTSTALPARLVRQVWDYRTIVVPAGQDAANVLASAGLDGWEATGVAFSSNDQHTLLLKRPRSY